MKILLAIGAGSFLGGIGRYLISGYFNKGNTFPWGTLWVNLAGCFLIGLFIALFQKQLLNRAFLPFVVTGVLGGFTTFSAFSLETFQLLKQGLFLQASAYIVLSVAGGAAVCAAGYFIIKTI